MSSSPRVSVVTTVRDGERYIEECIASILAQTMPDWEMVIVDDGSQDGTPQILGRLDDPRIRVETVTPHGRGRALNVALGLATAPYIAVLDADDVAWPDRLQTQADFLDSHPQVGVVGSATIPLIDADGRLLKQSQGSSTSDAEIRAQLQHGRNPLFHTTLMMRSDLLRRIGGYDESLEISFDHNVVIRVLEFSEAANLTQPMASHRLHGSKFFGGPFGLSASPRLRFRNVRAVQRQAVDSLDAPWHTAYIVPTRAFIRANLERVARSRLRRRNRWWESG